MRRAPPAPRTLARWLLACALAVVAVLVVGGITRLAHAGLSIVQWQPLAGVLPPLDEADWAQRLQAYRLSPEGRLVHPDLDLAGFRTIFWWEYAHRLLARLAGLLFVLPLLYWLAARRLPPRLVPRLLVLLALGGLQGALGWFMVASGLVDDPRVSPLRLAAHLALALLLIGALLWQAARLACPAPPAAAPVAAPGLRRHAGLALAAVFLLALTGALVAGTRAGFAFNTFPDMNGRLVPPGLWALEPLWRNFLHNLATVQFVHRAGALVVLLVVGSLGWRLLRSGGAALRRAGAALLLALGLQIALGIATLLSLVALPLAALHQLGAVALFASALAARYLLARPVPGA
jgi:cytochrome c oxidase assembly protein subunit 15